VRYYSTRDKVESKGFSDAVLQGLASDGGLYVPDHIPAVPTAVLSSSSTLADTAYLFMRPYVNAEIADDILKSIIDEVFNFPIPLIEIEENIYVLELFHGPTLAFKDVGARFMGRVLPILNQGGGELLVLVATSGDTGGAVANGLFNVPGVRVVVLYPCGKVSPLQEKQFASLKGNIQAVAVDGVFDDCQRLVKAAFDDEEVMGAHQLTTANSINIARWLPQAVYYFWMYAQLGEQAIISVPSGNLGNFTAGILAYESGLPVKRFISACNANDTFPGYLLSGDYNAKPSVETVANAMDVGDPSNFERFNYFLERDKFDIWNMISGTCYSDDQILDTISNCKARNGYLLDPHGACGYRALKEQLTKGEKGVFLATAHPAKFAEIYSRIGMKQPRHESLELIRDKPINPRRISSDFSDLKSLLLTSV